MNLVLPKCDSEPFSLTMAMEYCRDVNEFYSPNALSVMLTCHQGTCIDRGLYIRVSGVTGRESPDCRACETAI